MAKITLRGSEEYSLMLSKLAEKADGIAKRAVYHGGNVCANLIKKEIIHIPEQEHHRLKKGQRLSGVSKTQKLGLLHGFGMTPMEKDQNGNWNTKAGFDGYAAGTESKKYPKGIPVPMLARGVESGTPIRKKYPFIRKGVTAGRIAVVKTMDQSVNEDCKSIMKK